MNRDQSIKLWLKGKDAWNKWANKLLKEKQAMIDAGDWQAEKKYGNYGPIVGKNDKTKSWLNRASTDFSSLWLRSIDQPEGGNKKEPENPNQYKSIPLEETNVNFTDFVFPAYVSFNNTLFDCGKANFSDVKFGGDANFSDVKFGGDANFWDVKFGGDANFWGVMFGGYAYFWDVMFGGYAYFWDVMFGGDATFGGVKFGGDAYFSGVMFGGDATFGGVKFGGDASFNKTNFSKDATFNLSTFVKPVSFKKAVFEHKADFSSITSAKSFALSGTHFHQVPDFTESSFHAPPVLDDINVDEPVETRPWQWCEEENKSPQEPRNSYLYNWQVTNDPTDTRKYRALAKMASEAKDYQNEMKFFADEQRCRRFWHDKPFGEGAGRFWFGLIYEKLSDYGRNFWRPLASWGIFTFLIFPMLYRYFAIATYSNDIWPPVFLSIRHGLIISGLTKTGQLANHLKDLYGPVEELKWQASGLMLSQPLISAVFIFLFLLALRNQFKIR